MEKWRSDGTASGTVLVKDIAADQLTEVNGTLFFVASYDSSGLKLWRSDGTELGTTLVKDIWPGGGAGFPENLTNVDGTLFFTATDGVTARQV